MAAIRNCEAAKKRAATRSLLPDCHSTFLGASRKTSISGVGKLHSQEAMMPAYEIRYLDEGGGLTYKFSATCDNDQRAKILAHAMKLPSIKRLQVWSGEDLIYARPTVEGRDGGQRRMRAN
jgi:hypothetical protein